MDKKKVIIIVLSILVLLILLFILIPKPDKKNTNKPNNNKDEETPIVEKEVTIVDLNSNTRPYAVMINNHPYARPHSGLDKAYLIYELMVEGGITRMMALYTQDVELDKIGSIRSSRHNYLDYALENDAIYVHWGYSKYAEKDINTLGINNINGLIYGSTFFTTDTSLNRSLEHTRFTSSSLIKSGISSLGYRNTTDKGYLLNYTAETVDLSTKDQNIKANQINIKYSDSMTANYQYNENDQMYYRSIDNQPCVDLVTNEQYKFKNIIVYSVNYSTISSSGHQDLSNIGSGEGYYITNGHAVPIKWTKNSRLEKTIYTHLDGTEIEVSDGNTFIQIYPTSGSLTIN